MKTTLTFKLDGAVELSHNGEIMRDYAFSNIINYMREHNITEDETITEGE